MNRSRHSQKQWLAHWLTGRVGLPRSRPSPSCRAPFSGLTSAPRATKNSWLRSFLQSVFQVVHGDASITPSLARRLLGKFEPAGASAPASANPHKARGVLSEREKAVLTLVAAGHTSTDIGVRLGIGSQTVNTHIKNIYRKLNVHNRAHAVSFAATHGLL